MINLRCMIQPKGGYTRVVFPSVSPGERTMGALLQTAPAGTWGHPKKKTALYLTCHQMPRSWWSGTGTSELFLQILAEYCESLGMKKPKPEGNSLLTFPMPTSSASPWQVLPLLKSTSHRHFCPKKDKLLNKNVTLYSSVNAISALSRGGEAEWRGSIWIPHSLRETQLFCISQ